MATRRSVSGPTDAGDTLLAAGVLGLLLALAGDRRERFDPVVATAGALSAVGFEYAAAHHYDRIRGLWARPAVRATAAGAAIASASAIVRNDSSFSFAVGALGAYLGLLAAVVAGVVPHPTDW